MDRLRGVPADLVEYGRRHETVLAFKVDETVVATVAGIDVEDDEAARRAGGDPDVRIRPYPPPPGDDGWVIRRVVHPVQGPGVLAGAPAVLATAGAVSVADRVQRDDVPVPTGIREGRF